MKNFDASFICCPVCKNDLNPVDRNPMAGIDSNAYACSQCNRSYKVSGEIIQFLEAHEIAKFSFRMNLMRRIYAGIYTPATRIMFLPCGGEMKARHEVLDLLEIQDGASVLETGIGCGDNIPILKHRYGAGIYFGLDNQQRMLQKCTSNLKKWNLEARLHLAHAELLPYRENMFDVVFHLGAFNLFRKKKQAMDEMIRVAKPGTRVVIADETEKASKLYSIFLGKQEPVIPPVDLVPETMLEKRLDIIWNSYGYVLTFRKPV